MVCVWGGREPQRNSREGFTEKDELEFSSS